MESLEEKLRHAKILAEILAYFYNGKTWVVGGFLREVLLGNAPHDIDLATDVLPDNVLALDGKMYESIRVLTRPLGIEHGTVLVKISDPSTFEKSFEVTTLRKDVACDGRHATVEFSKDIYEDLARRDFTVNAMALSLNGRLEVKKIIDPFDGKNDLYNGLVRAVGDPKKRFEEDHLRMLRACRFAGKIGRIDFETGQAICWNCTKIGLVSKERIREEILKIMKQDSVKISLEAIWGNGLLSRVLPPLYECAGIDGGQHHDETVLEHCIEACQAIPKEKVLLRLAALLHDVGKPSTWEEKDGNISFLQHETVGAEIVENYLKEFKFSNEEIEYVTSMVRYHMFRFDLDTHKKTIKKWLNKINGRWEDLLLLRRADRLANKAKADRPLVTAFMEDLLDKIHEIENFKEPMKVTDLVVSGKDLIKLGLSPGPLFGKILNALLEKVLEDPELNKKEILLEKTCEIVKNLV